jgi:hypothetical protein
MASEEAEATAGTLRGPLFGDYKYSLIIFDGTNWADYSYQLLVIASRWKALGILEGTTARPTVAGSAEQQKFDDLNDRLFNLIFSTLNSVQRQILRPLPIGNGQRAFRELEKAFQPKTRAAVKQLLRKLLELKQEDDTMAIFISKISTISSQLEAALTTTGMSLIDLLRILVLLDGMDPALATLREQLLLDEELTFDTAANACTLRAEQVSYESSGDPGSMARAARGDRPYCKHCYEQTGRKFNNHTDATCFKLHPELRQQRPARPNGRHNVVAAAQQAQYSHSQAW